MHKTKTCNLKPRNCRAPCAGSPGVTLIDAVVGSALMLIVFVGIAGAFRLSIDVVINNKARSGAIALANERMEYVRSLSYDSVGTVGGIPAGVIPQSEVVTLNTVSYVLRTTIQYVDDPKDGTGVSDANAITSDYKAVRAEVSWMTRGHARSISLVTRIQPHNGMETAVAGGTLLLSVLDAGNQPVSSAAVSITNLSASPDIDIDTYTNIDGLVTLTGATTTGTYSIVITKSGYSTDQTYTLPNPFRAPLTVASNQTTSATFAIDLLSSLTVFTRAWGSENGMNGVFVLRGSKTISSDPLTYKYDSSLGGSSPTTTVQNLEWDTYLLSVASTTGYDLASSCPLQSIYVAPNTATSAVLYLAPHTAHSLPVAVKDNATNALLPGASVRLYKSGYDETEVTDSCGQTFFGSLSSGTYSIAVTAPGHAPFDASNVSVSGVTPLYEVTLN